MDTDPLLDAALQAARERSERAAASQAEVDALRGELDATHRGLMALHAELSAHQAELERARLVAEEATRTKADFLAVVSHEIRSPMNALLGFTDLLLDTDLSAEQREYAHAAQSAGRHLLGVVNDILDLSKMEAGRLDLEDIAFDLHVCVADAVAIASPLATRKNLALQVALVPEAPVVVHGDPLRLRQILVNLLSNAVKFTAEGRVALDVCYESCILTFGVSDTGSGISDDGIARLFTPFTQLDASVARTHGGTGLGLAICRQLVERMSGTIRVSSTMGEGTTFTCVIPLRPAAPDAPAAPA